MVIIMDCLFCKIVKKEENATILYEDDIVMVIMDVYPNVDGHCLVIPKKHYTTFYDVPDDELLHINKIAKKYSEILTKKLGKDSITLLVNWGEAQYIKHYHLHLLPNYGIEKEALHTKEEIAKILVD